MISNPALSRAALRIFRSGVSFRAMGAAIRVVRASIDVNDLDEDAAGACLVIALRQVVPALAEGAPS